MGRDAPVAGLSGAWNRSQWGRVATVTILMLAVGLACQKKGRGANSGKSGAAQAVGNAADKAADGVKKGAKATEKGLSKAAKGVGKGLRKAGDAVEETFE